MSEGNPDPSSPYAEPALPEAEEQLRIFVEHAPAAIAMLDTEMKYMLVSQRWLSDYQLRRADLIGRSHYEVFPELPERWKAVHQRCLRGATERNEADPFPRADGTVDWVRWEIRPWRRQSGEIGGIFILSEVITQRKEAESALARYAKRLEIMHEIDLGIINASSVHEIASTVLTHIRALIPCQSAAVSVFDDSAGPMRMRVPDQEGAPGSAQDMRYALRVPILFQGERLGLLEFETDQPALFTPEHQEIAEQIASQLAIAIHQQRLTHEIQSHTQQLTQMVRERTAELEVGKARVEAILNNSPDGILLMATDLTIQVASPSFSRLVGCEPEGCLQQSLLKFISRADVERVALLLQQVLATQEDVEIELGAQRQDGIVFDAELSVGSIKDDGLVCILRDIRVRKAQERQLRYHASLQANVSDAVIVTTPDFRIQSWNKAAERIYGWTDHEVMGKPAPEILRTELSAADRQRVIQSVYGSGWWREEVIQHHKDGSIRHILGSITKIDDEQGQPLSLVAVNHDITEYKQIENALRDSEERFRQVAENFDQALFIRSGDNSALLYVNPRYEQLLGAPRQVLYANPNAFLKLIHPEDVEHVRGQMTSRHYVEEGITEFEYRIVLADQQVRWMRTHTFPIKNENGEIVRRAGLVEDITAHKLAYAAMQEALAKEKELGELKSRFVSMASHEFRTPLSTILTISETLNAYWHRLTEAQIRQRLGTIKEQVGYLQGIMEDVLLLARMQAQHIEFRPVKTDPDALCRAILDEFRRLHASRTLRYSFDGKIDHALIDPKLMRHIVSNLVSNALKYSPEEAPVHIYLAQYDNALVLRISDNGIGIPEADMKHLFEPFHRGENVAAVSGTGLGLVIAKEAVEQHGGTIQVQSQVGMGTTFTVQIPNAA